MTKQSAPEKCPKCDSSDKEVRRTACTGGVAYEAHPWHSAGASVPVPPVAKTCSCGDPRCNYDFHHGNLRREAATVPVPQTQPVTIPPDLLRCPKCGSADVLPWNAGSQMMCGECRKIFFVPESVIRPEAVQTVPVVQPAKENSNEKASENDKVRVREGIAESNDVLRVSDAPPCRHKNIGEDTICKDCGHKAAIKFDGVVQQRAEPTMKTGKDFLKMFLEVEEMPPLYPTQETVVLAAMAAFAQYRTRHAVSKESAPRREQVQKLAFYHECDQGAGKYILLLDDVDRLLAAVTPSEDAPQQCDSNSVTYDEPRAMTAKEAEATRKLMDSILQAKTSEDSFYRDPAEDAPATPLSEEMQQVYNSLNVDRWHEIQHLKKSVEITRAVLFFLNDVCTEDSTIGEYRAKIEEALIATANLGQ